MSMKALLSQLVLLLCLVSPSICVSFNNDWVAELKGGEEMAKVVAKDTGCELIGEVLPDSNIFQVSNLSFIKNMQGNARIGKVLQEYAIMSKVLQESARFCKNMQ